MKFKMALLAMLVAGSAQAVEVGVTGGTTYGGSDRDGMGITIGQKYQNTGLEFGMERFNSGTRQDRYTVIGSYDVTKVGPVTVAVKGGAAYLDNAGSVSNGFAAQLGVGTSLPLTKQLSLTLDYRYQQSLQSRVEQFNGSNINAGVKYSF